MHRSVSSTADANDGEGVFFTFPSSFFDGLSACDVFVDDIRTMVDTCRDVRNRSSKT